MKNFLMVIFILFIISLDPRMFGEAALPSIMAFILFAVISFKKIKTLDFNDGLMLFCCTLLVSCLLHLFFVETKIFGNAESLILIFFNLWFIYIMYNFLLRKKSKKSN